MPSPAAGAPWSRSRAARLDQVCTRFEAVWQAGGQPQIDEFLSSVSEPECEDLFRELLAVELQWRHERQETPDPDEYHRRFPSRQAQVDAAFALAFDSSADDTSAGGDPIATTRLCVRCPRCQTPVEAAEGTPLSELTCPLCETHFDLGGEPLPKAASSSISPAPHQIVADHYELVEHLGTGAFGTVWKAHDRRLDRTVAVKIPRKGQLSPDETARFLREAQAAAQLHHPHIVGVHDAGLDGDTVYIVADFVEGRSLADWMVDPGISHREAARLCSKIARALSCAHESGVVHRDLKPANIMIDENGEPQIMDFGLAKRQSSEVTMTLEGQVLGTPAYMSPEQARGEGHFADGRTDVYSLGVILFELLTGERPFRGNVRMLLAQVLDDEPPSPRKLDGSVPRDLETICLKCLQKAPSSRYRSAAAVADELDRFLSGEPIQARPVSSFERNWRWCRRNPLVATSAALAVVGLFFGVLALAVSYVRVSRSLVQTQQAQQESDASLREARQAVDALFTRVSQDTLLNQPGMQPLRNDLLRRAREYYQRFLERSGHAPDVADELALAHFRVGLITEQIESPASAIASFEEARQLQQRLLASDARDLRRLRALGNTLNALGSCLKKQADPQAALKYYLEAVEIRQELVERMPADVECRRTLANTYMNIGLVQEPSEPGEARKHFERAQRIRQKMLTNGCDDLNVRRDLAKGYYNLADLAQAQNDLPAADGCLERAVGLFRELSQDDASGIEAEYSLALAYRKWADLKSLRQVPEDAISLYGDARELMSKLVRENPAVPAYRAGLAEICMNAGTIEHETGRHHEAVSSFTTAVELLADLLGDQSESARYRQLYLTSLSALPVVQAVAEHYADAYRTTETLRDYLVNDGCQEQALQTLETLREYVKQVVEMRTDDADARTLLEQMNAAIQSLREQQPKENAAN